MISRIFCADLIFLFSTRNKIYLIPFGFYLSTSLTFLSSNILGKHYLTIIFTIFAGIFFIILMFVLFTKKMKWRYREILELAAQSINEIKDGFTSRPFPFWKINYEKEEIFDLAKFESTFPYDDTRQQLSIKGRKFNTLIEDYTDDGGHLNVHGRMIIAEQLLIFLANLLANWSRKNSFIL